MESLLAPIVAFLIFGGYILFAIAVVVAVILGVVKLTQFMIEKF